MALNSNVRAVFLYTVFTYFSGALFQGDLLSVYIFKLTSSTLDVGAISAARGIAMVIFALPLGLISSKFRRDQMLKSASILGYITLGLTVYVFWGLKPGMKSLLIFYATFGLWGVFTAATNPNLESIFADSVETGKRSKIFTIKQMTIQFAASAGPLLTIAYYAFLGEGLDSWDLGRLRVILLVGTGICFIGLSTMWLFDDDKSLGAESESHISAHRSASRKSSNSILEGVEGAISMENDEDERDIPCCFIPRRLIPHVIAVCDLFMSIGAGMTIKFFPLFFVEKYNLSPISLSLVYFSNLIFGAFVSWFFQRMSALYFNRVIVMVAAKFIGTACLFVIATFDPKYEHIMIIAPLFVLRTAVQNSTGGIKRSLLMDCVKKKKRAQWNSFESITRFSWSGSAYLGGWIVEKYSYETMFLATACLYSVAAVEMCLLFAADVPLEKKREDNEANPIPMRRTSSGLPDAYDYHPLKKRTAIN